MKAILSVLALAVLVTAAQAQVETVVVTGSRVDDDSNNIPYVALVQRADHLITKVHVVCDTREYARRDDEMRQTLRSLIAEAGRTKSISLSVGDEFLNDFTADMIDKIIVADDRPDTSAASIVIRTELTPADTLDGATARIEDFVKRAPKVGRTEVLLNGRFNLGLITPEKYRDALIAEIAKDAKHTAAPFDDGFSVTVEGLQLPIQWRQVGPLDLGLYLPYRLTVAPVK